MFMLINLFSDSLCPVDGGIVTLEETTAIRMEMFYHRIKEITLSS